MYSIETPSKAPWLRLMLTADKAVGFFVTKVVRTVSFSNIFRNANYRLCLFNFFGNSQVKMTQIIRSTQLDKKQTKIGV